VDALQEAIRVGCDVPGWLVWTLLDGFECIDGLEQRFGLVRAAACPGHPSPSCATCSVLTEF
jgi:beta-glucosidase/6-phospho-beta-glucosidase/beta-galactosidase